MLKAQTDWKIPLYKIFCDEEDVQAVSKVISRGTYWAIGPEIEEFEEAVATLVGAEHGVAFNSGTSALHALLLAYDIKDGDEIIVPSFTFIATANAPLFVGAKPVFADVNEFYGLSPSDVKLKISPKTKAIMPIHYGGLPCQIEDLNELAEEHDLLLLEDAAESIGASVNDRKVGSFGDASMFSFCGNKVITTGEGGMIVTNSEDISRRLGLIRSHGRMGNEPYFSTVNTQDYVMLGYNWRMSSITAALGLSQLQKLDRVVNLRRRNAKYLTDKLKRLEDIAVPSFPQEYFNVYQMYSIRVKAGRSVRDALKNYLRDMGIMTKVYFEPVHLTSFYRERFGYSEGDFPVTETLASQVLILPMYPSLSEEEMDFMAGAIESFFSKGSG